MFRSMAIPSKENHPRLIISAAKGGSGKTILSLGLLRALALRGLRVAAFKKGPDYIDAKWLGLASKAPCYNLDPFLMDQETMLASFYARSEGKDVSVIEGNRGLYDGVDIEGASSTGELAKLLSCPVVVVLDCTKMTRTAAAIALGLKALDQRVAIRGVVLNHIAGTRHEKIVTDSIHALTELKVLGCIPRLRRDPIPMRHLGVTPVEEHPDAEKSLDDLGRLIEENVDVEALLDVAKGAPFMPPPLDRPLITTGTVRKGLKVGVIMDEAFQFYYPENLEAIRMNGGEIELISAISHKELPDIDLLYIGGGFPETQAQHLANNVSFRRSLRSAIEAGLPVYAECGGFMYLGKSITYKDATYPMVGALDYDFLVEKRPQGHGYSILCVDEPTPFFDQGMRLIGHEFHYSRPVRARGPGRAHLTCSVIRGRGIEQGMEGAVYKNVFATYTHLHALQQKDFGIRLLRAAMLFNRSRANQSKPSVNLSPGTHTPKSQENWS